ncbi:hypothetical protein GW17_00001631 [Ensete ventricosum]|nr:hypothetical protein GW17_00001631 [Ensete ventricosum]
MTKRHGKLKQLRGAINGSVKQRKEEREREDEATCLASPVHWIRRISSPFAAAVAVCVLGAVVCGGERKTDTGAEGAGMGGGMMDLHLLEECDLNDLSSEAWESHHHHYQIEGRVLVSPLPDQVAPGCMSSATELGNTKASPLDRISWLLGRPSGREREMAVSTY